MTNKKNTHKGKSRKNRRNDGKYFEKKTHALLSKMNPNKEVLHDVKIQGKLSESSRQLDVTLRDPNEYDFIAFECKDEKASIGTPTIEGYYTKLMDVGAKKGAVVSNSPFSRGARRMAEKLNIDLLHLIDTDDDAIKTKLFAPSGLINERVESWNIEFGEKPSDDFPFDTPDYSELKIILNDGKKMKIKELAAAIWAELGDSVDNGEEVRQYNDVKLDLSGKTIDLPPLIIKLIIKFQYRIGVMDITRSEGIYHVADGAYQTSSMAVGPFGQDIFDAWEEVSKDGLRERTLTTILHTRTDLMASNAASAPLLSRS